MKPAFSHKAFVSSLATAFGPSEKAAAGSARKR
jgi:hypothetical protein